MSEKGQILREIVSSVSLSSELDGSETVASDLEDSLLEVNGDDFRLDNQKGSSGSSSSRKSDTQEEAPGATQQLFVEDESFLTTPPVGLAHTPASPTNSLILEAEKSYYDEVDSIRTPKRKRVRFEQHKASSDNEEGTKGLHPWNFNNLIRKEFHERLPNSYEIKTWKRPSKTMLRSIIDVLENNIEPSLQTVFDKYGEECERVVGYNGLQKVQKNKQKLLLDIAGKIKQKLRKSRLPSRVSDKDMDIEYIFAKRKFIQERYSQELQHAEIIEHQLAREQKKLEDMRTFETKLSNRGEREVKALTQQLTQNLHPALNKAIVNSFGLIKDQEVNSYSFEKDVNNLNLLLDNDDTRGIRLGSQQKEDLLKKYLPAVQSYEEVNLKLRECIKEHVTSNRDVLQVNHLLNDKSE